MHSPLQEAAAVFLLVQVLEHEVNGLRNDSLAVHVYVAKDSHGIGLASSRLPVHEVGPIVTIENIQDKRLARLLEHLRLAAALVEDPVEGELLRYLFRYAQFNQLRTLTIVEGALPLLVVLGTRVEDVIVNFTLERRPNTNEDLDVFHGFPLTSKEIGVAVALRGRVIVNSGVNELRPKTRGSLHIVLIVTPGSQRQLALSRIHLALH